MAIAPKTRTILVVEDEPDMVTYLKSVLEDHGYVCVAASDVAEGMEKARTGRPDLICLDISMPEKSGVRMYREICDDPATCRTPVILVTGISKDVDRIMAGRRAAHPPAAIVAKPIEREEFLDKVKEALEKH